MSSIFITILGIVFFVLIAIGGLSYVNHSIIPREEFITTIETGFINLTAQYNIQMQATNGILPSNNASNWSDYFTKPIAPEGLDWSYLKTGSGKSAEGYFCLSGTLNDEQFFEDVILSLMPKFTGLIVNTSCGATSSSGTYDTNFAITLHLNK